MGKYENKPQQPQRREPSQAQQRARRKEAHRKKTVLLVSVVVAVVLVIGCFVGFVLLRDDGKIVGNLYVCGVDVGGMTKEEAKAAIAQSLKIYDENTMQVDLYGREFPLYTTTYDPAKVQLVDIFGKPMDPSEASAAAEESEPSEQTEETSEATEPTEPTEPAKQTPADAPLDENGKPLTYLGGLSSFFKSSASLSSCVLVQSNTGIKL